VFIYTRTIWRDFGYWARYLLLSYVIFRGQCLRYKPANSVTEGRHPPTHDSMSPNATDNPDGRTTTDEDQRRYAELNIGDEEFVIYDRENHQAWLQSTVAVPVEESR